MARRQTRLMGLRGPGSLLDTSGAARDFDPIQSPNHGLFLAVSGGALEIKPGRMIHLGYGKYWRSEEIVGLLPIEDGRGPGRRTEVYVATLEEPVVASRSEQTILQDMASLPEEIAKATEALSATEDLLDAMQELSPVLRRMLKNEESFDVEYWIRRLGALTQPPDEEDQEELF